MAPVISLFPAIKDLQDLTSAVSRILAKASVESGTIVY